MSCHNVADATGDHGPVQPLVVGASNASSSMIAVESDCGGLAGTIVLDPPNRTGALGTARNRTDCDQFRIRSKGHFRVAWTATKRSGPWPRAPISKRRSGKSVGRPGVAIPWKMKIRIVLEGLKDDDSIAELCRREGPSPNLHYSGSDESLEAGKRRLQEIWGRRRRRGRWTGRRWTWSIAHRGRGRDQRGAESPAGSAWAGMSGRATSLRSQLKY